MSTAGTYNYRPKVANPDAVLYQMTGDNLLPPFYFGGAQTPTALGISRGSGLRSKNYVNSNIARKIIDVKGRGIHPHYEHTEKIILPKNFRRI